MTNNKTLYAINTPDGTLQIRIRLDDECKNGFSEFAITGNIREKGHGRIAGRCLHDDIAKYAPEYKTIIGLHLSDVDGVPMYAVENGMYHMAKDAKVGLEYLRLEHINDADKKTLELIAKTNDKNMFYSRLLKNGIFEYRKTQAQAAIALLGYSSEGLKARKLEYSTKAIPSNGELEHIIELDTQAKKQSKLDDEVKRYITNQKKDKKEHTIKMAMYAIDDNDNFIYYNHTNTLALNWRNYGDIYPVDKIPQVENYCKQENIVLTIK